jgi:hypothetical protein
MHPRVERRYSLRVFGFSPTQATQEEAIAQIPQDPARVSTAPPAGHGCSPPTACQPLSLSPIRVTIVPGLSLGSREWAAAHLTRPGGEYYLYMARRGMVLEGYPLLTLHRLKSLPPP